MANQNQKHQKQPEQKTSEQQTTPAQPVELTDEELGQVVGGVIAIIMPNALPDLDAGAH